MDPDLLLSVRDLRTHYFVRTGVFKRVAGYVKAVDGVTFGVGPRESLGIVGESGCGKSTVGAHHHAQRKPARRHDGG